MTSPIPQALKGDEQGLQIQWSDGMLHRLSWRQLRDHCPCATCRVKRDEPPPILGILQPQEAQPIRATGMKPLGNYAYHIDFNDGHSTGIYSLELLRSLGEKHH